MSYRLNQSKKLLVQSQFHSLALFMLRSDKFTLFFLLYYSFFIVTQQARCNIINSVHFKLMRNTKWYNLRYWYNIKIAKAVVIILQKES